MFDLSEEWKESKPHPEYVRPDGVTLRVGDRVRLKPSRNADVFDIALRDQLAVIATIEQDFEGHFYVTVTLDDDPGRDFGEASLPAHRFFFGPDEVEPA